MLLYIFGLFFFLIVWQFGATLKNLLVISWYV